ncbi:hypothetical protein OQA88_5191 [Cercophora sp. LCS_1]
MDNPFQDEPDQDNRGDREALGDTCCVDVDFEDDQWVIDINLRNIITTIKPRQMGVTEKLRWSWGGILKATRRGKPEQSPSRSEEAIELQPPESYLINFAVLQRIHIRQLRTKLMRQAVDLRFNAREPPGGPKRFNSTAVKDYEYMEGRHLLPDDPFYVSGAKFSDRALLKHLIRDRGHHISQTVTVEGPWETEDTDKSSVGSKIRPRNYRQSWIWGFIERFGVAALSAGFLVAPI